MEGHDQQNSRFKLIAFVTTLGLISAALGFATEVTRLQLDDLTDYGIGCTYPSHSGTTILGVLALVALLGFRVYCPGTRNPSSMVQLSRSLSWAAWLVALIYYAYGLYMVESQGGTLLHRDDLRNYYKCAVVKPGIFGAGASFTLTSVVLEIVYLVATQHTDKTTSVPSTGQPSNV